MNECTSYFSLFSPRNFDVALQSIYTRIQLLHSAMTSSGTILNGTRLLSTIDYVVFAALLSFSALIGVYYACTGGKQKTASEFLMANRQMGVLPVTLSLLASFMSAITLLGMPSEIYWFGTQYMLIGGSYLFVIAICSHVILPIFYRMQLTSAYEYLEMRFHKYNRLAGTLAITLQMTMYMGVVLYAPALALNAVTGLSWTTSLLLLGAVCTFYTTIGGMKAVMWTDVFQTVVMFLGMLTALIMGCIEVGGVSNVWDAAQRGDRIQFFTLDPNPLTRHTVWTQVVGGTFTLLVIYGINQSQVQRYCATRTMRKAKIALWLNLPGLLTMLIISCSLGLIAHAYYETCDPISTKVIQKSDQILPLFVMDICSRIPGFPGLFISAIFSGSMSTVSSGVNSLAAMTLEDIIKPYFLRFFRRYEHGLSEQQGAVVSKILALSYGVLAVAVAFLASFMGNLTQAALAIFGIVGGPLLGVFLLGMLFTCANWKGALFGHIFGSAAALWIGFGGFVYKYPTPHAPFNVSGCPVNVTVNMTEIALKLAAEESLRNEYDGLTVYRLSYMWQGALATLSTVIIGLIASGLTGCSRRENVDPDLLVWNYNRSEKSKRRTKRPSAQWVDPIQPRGYEQVGCPMSPSNSPWTAVSKDCDTNC